jgi:hypothetical protein
MRKTLLKNTVRTTRPTTLLEYILAFQSIVSTMGTVIIVDLQLWPWMEFDTIVVSVIAFDENM